MRHWGGWVFIVGGCLLASEALRAKHALNEVDYPVSEEERGRYPAPTTRQRLLVVAVGVSAALFGLLSLLFGH